MRENIYETVKAIAQDAIHASTHSDHNSWDSIKDRIKGLSPMQAAYAGMGAVMLLNDTDEDNELSDPNAASDLATLLEMWAS